MKKTFVIVLTLLSFSTSYAQSQLEDKCPNSLSFDGTGYVSGQLKNGATLTGTIENPLLHFYFASVSHGWKKHGSGDYDLTIKCNYIDQSNNFFTISSGATFAKETPFIELNGFWRESINSEQADTGLYGRICTSNNLNVDDCLFSIN